MNQLQTNNNTDGLLESNTQQLTNLVLMDNRDILTEEVREEPTINTGSSVHQLNEQQWSLLKLCARPTIIQKFTWTSSSGGPLAVITLPIQAAGALSYWKQLFQTFSFSKFDMHVRVQLNTTKFHSGRLALTWNPMSSFEPPTAGLSATIWSATSLPHSIIDASMSNSAELTIPFQHYYSYMPLIGESNISTALGTLTIENLTGLQYTTSTVPTVTGQVWFWFTNMELYVPTTTHRVFGPVEAQSGVLEQKLVLVEKLGKQATSMIGMGKDVVGTAANLIGLADSPTDPLPQQKVMFSNGPTSHGRGISSCIRLALDPVSEVITQPKDIATNLDEMDLTHIIKKSALLTTQDIKDTDLEVSIPINPMTVLNIDTNVYPTFLAYVARKFAFWRGPLKYRFEFVCSNFHSGRFIASFIPNTSQYKGTTSNMATCPSIIMDLQEKRTFEFVVPYVSQQPYKKISDFKTIDSQINLNESTGILVVRTLNKIAYPGSVSPFCQLWIYVSAPEGFELAVPNTVSNPVTQNLILNDADVFPVKYEVEAQSSYLAVENNQENQQVPVLGNTRSIVLNDNSLYNENFMHLSNYLARNSCSFRYDFAEVYQWKFLIPIGTDLQYLTALGKRTNFRDNITWFSKLFTFWRGSIRVASLNNFGRSVNGTLVGITKPLELTNNDAIGKILDIKTDSVYDSMSGNAFQFTNTPMSPVIELETPYYTQFQNMLNRDPVEGYTNFYPDSNDGRFAGELQIVYDVGKKETDFQFRSAGYLTRSVGPDFNFSYIGRPPILSK
jgi:hypothetical protein